MHLKILLPLLLCLLLAVLWRYTPNRKIWAAFATITVLASLSVGYALREKPPEPMSEAQREEIRQQQEIFAPWYEAHKKQLDHLDYNWQQYHNILESYKEDAISLQTAHLRLTLLEKEAEQTTKDVDALVPPLALLGANYDLVTNIRAKTLAYAKAQQQTIHRTRIASDPAQRLNADHEEESRTLEDIMMRESPVGLFTATEVNALIANLTLPEEKERKGEK